MTPKERGCKYGKDGKCRVVLSNSFFGNDWRSQMQNTAKSAATYEPVMNITNSPPNPKIWVQITMDDLGKAGQKLK